MGILDDTAELLLQMPDLNLSINQLFAGVEPDEAVDPAIDITTYGDDPPEFVLERARPAVEAIRVQLTFRSRDFHEAQDLAERVYGEMWETGGGQDLNGMQYVNFYPISFPSELPSSPDPNGRYTIAFRARGRRKP